MNLEKIGNNASEDNIDADLVTVPDSEMQHRYSKKTKIN